MMYRTGAFWRWFLSPLVGIFSIAMVLVVIIPSPQGAQSHQTAGQALACSVIFLAIGIVCGLVPWVMWTARLWLTETSIKAQFRSRTKEIPKTQIYRYAIQPGVRMGIIPIQPSSYILYGSDNKVLGEVQGYFERPADLRAWLEKTVVQNTGKKNPN